MATSKLAVVNSALNDLGEPQVETLTDTRAARDIDAIYDVTLRDMLRDYDWNFATKRATLTADTLTTEEALEWDYVYLKPNDWIATHRLSMTGDFERNPYLLFADEQNRVLARDTPMYMKYTFLQEDTTEFDSTFDEALSLSLAVKSGYKITQSGALKERLTMALRDKRPMASHQSAGDQRPRFKPAGSWRRARMTHGHGLIWSNV